MILKSDIVKNLSKLSLGTVAAQSIPLLFSPFIARLYSAEQYGYFAAILALVNIFSVIVNGRYELGIVLPEKDKDSNSLIVGSWFIGVFMSLVVFVGLWAFSDLISSQLKIDFGIVDSFIVSVMILSIAIWQPLNYFFIRQKAFGTMVYNKIAKTASLTFVTILLGWMGWSYFSNGLVLGFFIGWVILLFFSIYQAKKIGLSILNVNWKEVKEQLKTYQDYPIFNSLPALLNSFGTQMGVYIFTIYFSQEITGYYSFARQYVYVPMGIIGVSLSQVYFQRISEKFKKKKSIIKELKLLILILAAIGLLAIVVVQLFVVDTFEIVFGAKWILSAVMAKTLIFYFAFQFLVSPLSNILNALNRIKLASIFPIVYVGSLSMLFLLPKQDLENFLPYYVLAESLPYLFYLALIIMAVMQYEGTLKKNSL